MQEIADAAVAMGRAVELTREAAARVAATVDELRALQVDICTKQSFQNRTLSSKYAFPRGANVCAIEQDETGG